MNLALDEKGIKSNTIPPLQIRKKYLRYRLVLLSYISAYLDIIHSLFFK